MGGGLWTRPIALACLSSFAIWLSSYAMVGTLTLNAVLLGVPESQVGYYQANNSFFALVSQVISGRLLARYPRTAMMRLGALLVVAGSLVGLFALTSHPLHVLGALFPVGSAIFQRGAVVLDA
jgi:MFS family permease